MNATQLSASPMQQLQTLMRELTTAAKHVALVTVGKVKQGTVELRSRINIENTRQLKAAGFDVGTRFRVNYQPGVVEIVRDEQGSSVIAPKRFARRDGTEVVGQRLDLRSTQIHEQFSGEEQVMAVYPEGRMVFLHLPTAATSLARTERLREALTRGTIRTAALCSGIGTLDAALHEGFEQAGLNSEMAVANDNWDMGVHCLLNDNPAATSRTTTFECGIEQPLALVRPSTTSTWW